MTEEVKDQETTQEATIPAPEQATQPAAGEGLNISDLNAVRSIIDVATQRGAFKAAELEAVGKIYNRISTFLDSVQKKD
jgi:hypothetical protein